MLNIFLIVAGMEEASYSLFSKGPFEPKKKTKNQK